MAGPDQHLRASDAEREQVIEQLRRHAADGRLTMDEFEQRVAEALAARTRGDLAPVLRELPSLPSAPRPDPRTRSRRRLPVPSARALFTVAALAVATVLFVQGMWWIVFPLMGVLGGCGRSGTCASRHATHHRRHHHRRDGAVDDGELIHV